MLRPEQTLFFLLKSEKWGPYRDYWFEVHGTEATTFIFGFLTVLMMPILFSAVRRCENAIQFWSGVRTLAKCKSNEFLESVVVINQQSQITFHPEGLRPKLKLLFWLTRSKVYVFVLFACIYGLDQIRSDGFRCRNLKKGAGFLLSNETQPADYLNSTFARIGEMRKQIEVGGSHLERPIYRIIFVDMTKC